MPKFSFALTNGKTLTLEGDTQPSDADAEQAAKDAGVSLQPAPAVGSPEERKASIAALNLANAKPLPATPTLADEFTPAKMGERALAGAKGEALGFGAGIAAPALALYHTLRHPVDTAEKAGQAALMAGAAGYHAVTNPGETYDAAKNAALRLGANPEAIGGVAGGLGATLALGGAGVSRPGLVQLAKGTRVGQAVAAGASDAMNRIPGVAAARKVLATPAAPGPTMTPQGRPSWPPLGGEPSTMLPAGTKDRLAALGVPLDKIDTLTMEEANTLLTQAAPPAAGVSARFTPEDLARATTIESGMDNVVRSNVPRARAVKGPGGTILQPIKSQLEQALAHELAKRSK